jgi:hypothetical protein
MRKDVYRLNGGSTLPTPKQGKAIVFINGEQIRYVVMGSKLRLDREDVDKIQNPTHATVWGYQSEDELDIAIETEEAEKQIIDLRKRVMIFSSHNEEREVYIANLERIYSKLKVSKQELLDVLQSAKNINGIIGANIIEANKTNDALKNELEKDIERLDTKWTNMHIQFSKFKDEVNGSLVIANKLLGESKEMINNIVSLSSKIKRDIEIGRGDIKELVKQSEQSINSLSKGLHTKFRKAKDSIIGKLTELMAENESAFKKSREPQSEIYLKDRGDGKTNEIFTVFGKLQTR